MWWERETSSKRCPPDLPSQAKPQLAQRERKEEDADEVKVATKLDEIAQPDERRRTWCGPTAAVLQKVPSLAKQFPELAHATELMRANAQWAANMSNAHKPAQTPLCNADIPEPVYKRLRTKLDATRKRSAAAMTDALAGMRAVIRESQMYVRCEWCGECAGVHVDNKLGRMCAECDAKHAVAMENETSMEDFVQEVTDSAMAKAAERRDAQAQLDRGRPNNAGAHDEDNNGTGRESSGTNAAGGMPCQRSGTMHARCLIRRRGPQHARQWGNAAAPSS